MKKNISNLNAIRKEIKNELISIGNEPNIDNLEQYISQNKIFSFLFYSKIIPDFESILSLLNNLYKKFDSMKLILCISSSFPSVISFPPNIYK